MQVNIPFRSYWAGKVQRGIKTCSTRPTRFGKEGDTFCIFGATLRITAVHRHELRYVAAHLWRQEGCENPDHFQKVWAMIHPRKGFVPDWMVYVHFFERIDNA